MWQELYEIVFRYLRKQGLSPMDAEDLAQETLLATYLHLGGIAEGKLKAYLLAAAKHKYIDFLRKRAKTSAAPLADLFPMMSTEEPYQQTESRETIKAALRKLSPGERQLLNLKYILGLTSADIASLLHVKPDSVKAMLYRIRRKVKEHLQEEEH